MHNRSRNLDRITALLGRRCRCDFLIQLGTDSREVLGLSGSYDDSSSRRNDPVLRSFAEKRVLGELRRDEKCDDIRRGTSVARKAPLRPFNHGTMYILR